MNVNNNMGVISQTYLREMYGAQNRDNRPEQAPEAAQVRPGQVPGRDTLFLSAEARRMYQVNRDLNVNEDILDQQGDIYRPGLEVTVMRSEQSLQPRQAERPEVPVVSRPEAPETDNLNRLEMEAPSGVETASRSNNTERPERLSDNQDDRGIAARQNPTSESVNVNNVNSSSLVQAYAAAANVNQASYTVNFKV